MSDLVSKQDLLETMYEEVFLKDGADTKWDSGCWVRYKLFENILSYAPVIDAVPVVHAHLINPDPVGECSSCGYLIDIRHEYNYCPNCGAKMDGGKEDV